MTAMRGNAAWLKVIMVALAGLAPLALPAQKTAPASTRAVSGRRHW